MHFLRLAAARLQLLDNGVDKKVDLRGILLQVAVHDVSTQYRSY